MTSGPADPSHVAVPGAVAPDEYRHVLGHFATGVTVITTVAGGEPAGFTCQSFGALSLDPPLVLFCPSRSSSTGSRIIESGRFCVNVLADSQRELARVFASKSADKFAGIGWSPSPAGLPLLDGAHAWVDAAVETVHEAGDHRLVIGGVTALGAGAAGSGNDAGYADGTGHAASAGPPGAGSPLLFYRGRFTATEPESGAPEIVDTLLAWPRHADWM
jgi:3-hydroxy-9,10-secoandrosta-1,3,5(10)-triene-9,17-dione monooxygenase reductase component